MSVVEKTIIWAASTEKKKKKKNSLNHFYQLPYIFKRTKITKSWFLRMVKKLNKAMPSLYSLHFSYYAMILW